MNKRRKILTVAALAVFGAIIALHYLWIPDRYLNLRPPLTEDVRMPLFVLAVFYAGLFFLFGGKVAEPVLRRRRNWRHINTVILALLVVAGTGAGMIYSHEQERRSERSRRDAIEEEVSKHRITSSEIDLIDLRLERPGSLFGTGYLTGRIRNRSAQNSTLKSITLIVTLHEKEGSPDILGDQTVEIRVEVPPHQTRAISEPIHFPNLPKLTQHAWTYFISEIRGSKGYDFDPDKYLELTPTPSPKRDIFDEVAEEEGAKKKHGTAKPSDIIETVDSKTGKRKKIDFSNLPGASPTP